MTATKQMKKVSGSQVVRRPTGGTAGGEDLHTDLSPQVKIRGVRNEAQIGETKSEFNMPITSKKPKHDWEDNKTRLNIAQSFVGKKQHSKSPVGGRRFELGVGHEAHFDHMSAVVDNRDKLIEAEVYKEGYNKLK